MKKKYGFLTALLISGVWQTPSAEAGTLALENNSSGHSALHAKLYVTLEDPDALGVVDPESKKRLGTISVGGKPHDVICAPDGATAYVTNPETNNLSIVDTSTDKVMKTVAFGENATPWHVEISPDGSQVFAALQDQSEVVIIDTAHNRITSKVSVTSGPWAIAAPRSDVVYATLNGSISKGTANRARSDDIAVFDPTAASPTVKYLTLAADTANGPHGIVSAPDGSAVYVAAQASHDVWKINVDDNRVERVVQIPDPDPNGTPLNPGFPTDLAISPDGNTLIAVNHDLDSLTAINLKTHTIIETVSTGKGSQPWGAFIAPDGQTVYVSTNGVDSIAFFPMNELIDGTEGANKSTIAGLPTSDGFTWCELAQ
jgi:YVTN family beta-propeller protein